MIVATKDSEQWGFMTTCQGAKIPLPHTSTAIDWEAELVAVIGRPARDVSVEDALRYVAGYTIANDLSARDLFRRTQLPHHDIRRPRRLLLDKHGEIIDQFLGGGLRIGILQLNHNLLMSGSLD